MSNIAPGLDRRWKEDWDNALQTSPRWRAREQRLRRVPGVGRILALTLLAELPELGTQQQLAALVGVAPLHRDRGLVSGKRLIWGGRARVRAALFMRSLAAVRYTRVLHASWVRLRERGKPKTVALVACRHKLLTILNAMFKQPWQPRLAA